MVMSSRCSWERQSWSETRSCPRPSQGCESSCMPPSRLPYGSSSRRAARLATPLRQALQQHAGKLARPQTAVHTQASKTMVAGALVSARELLSDNATLQQLKGEHYDVLLRDTSCALLLVLLPHGWPPAR